jgi:hypothetical protein
VASSVSRAGRFVKQPAGYTAFVPAPLPPDPDGRGDGWVALDGVARTLPNPDLFVAMYVRREAVLSSQIEGTQSTLEDVLSCELDPRWRDVPQDVEEVVNYVRAMNYGAGRAEGSGLGGARLGRPVRARWGTFLAQAFSGSMLLVFLLPTAVCLVAVLILCAIVNDRRLDPSHRPPPYRLKEFLSSFWVNPVRYPDFGWAWLSRFLVLMGYATLTSFQVFYLIDHLGIGQERVAQLVFFSTLILQGSVVAVSILSGWLSDSTGRREIFVLTSATTYAVALAIIAFAGSLNTFFVGIGLGVCLAVDLALVADVLPDPDNAARDLGVFNIANAMPQSLAPAIAPIFLAVPLLASGEGGNYTALYFAAAVFALLGALAIQPVKGVK